MKKGSGGLVRTPSEAPHPPCPLSRSITFLHKLTLAPYKPRKQPGAVTGFPGGKGCPLPAGKRQPHSRSQPSRDHSLPQPFCQPTLAQTCLHAGTQRPKSHPRPVSQEPLPTQKYPKASSIIAMSHNPDTAHGPRHWSDLTPRPS